MVMTNLRGLNVLSTIRVVALTIAALMATVSPGVVAAQPQAPPPAAPADLRVERGDGTATLSWARVAGADGYRVFVAAGDGPEILLGSTAAASAIVEALPNENEYRFRVMPFVGDTNGPSSLTVVARPLVGSQPVNPPAAVPAAAMAPPPPPEPASQTAAIPIAPAVQQPPSTVAAIGVEPAINAVAAPVPLEAAPVAVAGLKTERPMPRLPSRSAPSTRQARGRP